MSLVKLLSKKVMILTNFLTLKDQMRTQEQRAMLFVHWLGDGLDFPHGC